MRKIWRAKWFCAAVAALLLLSMLPAREARASWDGVPYIDETGNPASAGGVLVIGNVTNDYLDLGGPPDSTWYLMMGSITINRGITVTGDVHMILGNDCALTVNGDHFTAGIDVTSGNSLTIYAQSLEEATAGKLTATGGTDGAGIGGGMGGAGGTITINGGNIEATGGSAGAGIGGGLEGAGGSIKIRGGSVTAKGGGAAAAIGGGGIGEGGSIEISGTAKVTATGGSSGAGIGGGSEGDSGTINILGSGARVAAVGGPTREYVGGGAGIGSGGSASSTDPSPVDSITIENMTTIVKAQGGAQTGLSSNGAGAQIGTGGMWEGKPGLEAVSITAQPQSATVSTGGSASFSMAAKLMQNVSIPLTYQWQRPSGANWADISGATSAQFTINPVASANQGRYRCMVAGYVPSNEAELTVRQPAPPPSPRPAIGDDAVFTGSASGGARIEVPFTGAPSGMKVELSAGERTYSDTVGNDGVATFAIPAGALEPGTYPLSIQSPGGSPLSPTPIGKLIIKYRPAVSGASALTVLPGAGFPLGFLVDLTGSDPENPTRLTLSAGGASATLDQRGDGTVRFSLALDPSAAGAIPVVASAPATATSEAVPETAVGTVSVLDASAHLSGDLRGKLGAGWLLGRAGANVPVAFQGEGAMLDEQTGALSIENKGALRVAINYLAPGKLTGALSKVRQSPFAVPKAAQPVPARLELKAEAKISKSLKAASFNFAAQDMAQLEPGDYTFSIQAAPSGKFQGFGPLTLATVRIADGTATPTEWTLPSSLRVSAGQQYQLVRPIPQGGALPALTTTTSDKKVATLNGSGVLTAKKSGTATVKARAADGSVLKCKLTVVPNSFSRSKPLYIKGKPGLYTSTRRLYYEKGALKAEIFVCNLSGQVLYGADAWVFELYDGERLVYQQPILPATFNTPLKNKKYAAYKLTLTDAQLPGISQKSLDLGSKRFQAVIRGGGAHPITPSTPGAVQAK